MPKPHTRSLLLITLTIQLTGCGPSTTHLQSLAAAGHIDTQAPVQAHLKIQISAPPQTVWTLLTNAASWPTWNQQITAVNLTGPLTPGKHFAWTTNGTAIHSQVQLCTPAQTPSAASTLAWTGTALTAHAIHVWRLTPTPNNTTQVQIEESMDGPLIAQLFPSAKLTKAAQAWLNALKSAAESHHA